MTRTKLEAWIIQQATSALGLLRQDLAKRMGLPKPDCRLLYRRIKQIGTKYHYTPGRWRDAEDRRLTRFTLDRGKPIYRPTLAEKR